jgi:Holliday junction resolvase RusA-like endonuclease
MMPGDVTADSIFVTIFVPGAPRGKGRPRFGRHGDFVRVWTDDKTENYEQVLETAARVQMLNKQRREGPLSVRIEAAFAVPASWSRKRRDAALAGVKCHTSKPDFDNIAKIVGDALNKIVWKDDSQIVACTFVKFYSERPGLKIIVAEW